MNDPARALRWDAESIRGAIAVFGSVGEHQAAAKLAAAVESALDPDGSPEARLAALARFVEAITEAPRERPHEVVMTRTQRVVPRRS